MRHNWGVPSPGPTNMGLNLSLWASKWPLHLQMVKNANTNTANQMVSSQSMLEIHYQASLVLTFSQTRNCSHRHSSDFFLCSHLNWYLAFKPKKLFTNYIFCCNLNMEFFCFHNGDGPYFLYFNNICGKSAGNLGLHCCAKNNWIWYKKIAPNSWQ